MSPHLFRSAAVGLLGIALAVTGQTLPAAGDDGSGAPPLPAPELTEQVVDDATERITVTPDGTFIQDEWTPPSADAEPDDGTGIAAAESEVGEASLASTFLLNSKPGALRTVYLDFDGGTLLSTNAWLKYGLSSLIVPRWSMDAYDSFSDAEKRIIQEVWARVAEDYAPFDVNVTTQAPLLTDLYRGTSSDQRYGTRVAFSSGSRVQSEICSGGCGGIAWIGTFDTVTSGEVRSPAWVFPGSLGNRAKSMAEAASHEVGHNLGLSHDGTTTSSYYGGTALWGPLMGSPYSSGVTQWSKGEYPRASQTQDDYAVMLSHGAGVRADEAGQSTSTALPLQDLPGGKGYITTRSDVDWFAMDACTSSVSVSATPAAVGPNLDLKVEVRDATGTVLASAAPLTVRTTAGISGLGASLQKAITPGGPYYVTVSGVGSGAAGVDTWSDGYGDYGSLGAYALSISGCSGTDGSTIDSPVTPPTTTTLRRPSRPAAPAASPGARGGRRTAIARWQQPSTGGTPINAYVVVASRLDRRGRVVAQKVSATLSPRARRIEMRLPRGKWVFRVKAHNKIGWSSLSAPSRRVSSR